MNNVSLSGCAIAYLAIDLLKDILVAPKFWQLWIKLYKYLSVGLWVDMNFQFRQESIKEHNSEIAS